MSEKGDKNTNAFLYNHSLFYFWGIKSSNLNFEKGNFKGFPGKIP